MALPQARAPPCQRYRPSGARQRRFPIDLVKTWLVEEDLTQVLGAWAGEKRCLLLRLCPQAYAWARATAAARRQSWGLCFRWAPWCAPAHNYISRVPACRARTGRPRLRALVRQRLQPRRRPVRPLPRLRPRCAGTPASPCWGGVARLTRPRRCGPELRRLAVDLACVRRRCVPVYV